MPKLRFQRNKITYEETKDMIERAKSLRNKAMIALLYLTGARISEILSVKREDFVVDEKKKMIIVNISVEKRGENWVHSVPMGFNAPFMTYIARWLDANNSGLLFPIGRIRAWRIVHQLNSDVWPHAFRRNRGNRLIDKGASPHELMTWMGWKSISTADNYITRTSSRIEKFAGELR